MNYPDTPEGWIEYHLACKSHNDYYDSLRPKPEDFNSTDEYTTAYSRWHFDKCMSLPNKPGYAVSNND
jgi:hypothetical protein